MRARVTVDAGAAAAPLWRLARRLWPYRNPLARVADRVEAAALLLVVLVGLLMTPVAAARGSEAYATQRAITDELSRTHRPTTAVLLADPPLLSAVSPGRVVHGKTSVPVRWSLPDGTVRTGQVLADDWLHAGTQLAIWLDRFGNPVDPPPTADTPIVTGLGVALVSWLVVMTLLIAGLAALRLLLGRSRRAAWHRDWESVEPEWSRRAGT
jgi:hypothetical protein